MREWSNRSLVIHYTSRLKPTKQEPRGPAPSSSIPARVSENSKASRARVLCECPAAIVLENCSGLIRHWLLICLITVVSFVTGAFHVLARSSSGCQLGTWWVDVPLHCLLYRHYPGALRPTYAPQVCAVGFYERTTPRVCPIQCGILIQPFSVWVVSSWL